MYKLILLAVSAGSFLLANVDSQFDVSKKCILTFSPAIGWNNYNKYLLGIALYNGIIFKQPIEYAFIPMYSFGSQELNGTGRIAFNFNALSSLKVKDVSFELRGSQFSYKTSPIELNFRRIISIKIAKTNSASRFHCLTGNQRT